MRIALPRRAVGALLAAGLALGCVTPVSEEEVESQLEVAAAPYTHLGPRRVIPIYAETRLVASALLAEARTNPESPPSERLHRRLSAAARRDLHVVVGGPYPELSDRLLTNALALSEKRGLLGLPVVFVSPLEPTPDLSAAAHRAGARLYHRER